MAYAVYLKVSSASYQKFLEIQTQLNNKTKTKQAHALGEVFAEVAVQIVQQVFVDLLEQQKQRIRMAEGYKIADEAEKVVAHVLNAIEKYLPWSIALLSNERLVPVVDYFNGMLVQEENQLYLKYTVSDDVAAQTFASIEKVEHADAAAIPVAFACLIEIIDQCMQQLIVQPKQMLKFNVVVDKTLNGVIYLCCNLAYKRLTHLGQEVSLDVAPQYISHFLSFLRAE